MADLTPEQIRLEQERLDLIQRQNQAAKELASTYEKMAKSKTKLTQDEKELLGLTKQLSDMSTTIESSVNKRLSGSASIKDLEKTVNNLKNDQVRMDNALRDYAQKTSDLKQKSLSNALSLHQKERNIQKEIREELSRQDEIRDQIEVLRTSSIPADKDEVKRLREKLRDSESTLKIKEKDLQKTTAQKDEQKELVKQLNASLKAHEKIKSEQQKELELAEQALAQAKKKAILDALGEKFKAKEIAQMFTMVGLMKMIVDAALKSDEQTTALAKSFGISKSAAKDIRDNMVSFSYAANSSFVTVDRLFKAQQALTEQLGIAVDFGGKEQEQFARLTEIVGLTAEEAGKLAKFSAANGMSTDKYVASIRESVFHAQRANKIHVSDKEILSTISKLSAGILVKFQGNPKAIAEAVVQAKALGTTLEQVDKTGESLLNWESSIENELKAELITGRQLNLEKARAAALSGNQVELMREMASQAGSLANFQNMNVIAQKSLAEAFGMSREEMSEMLMKQEAINKYGSKAAEMNAKQLEDFEKSGMTLDKYLEKQDEQRSIQEKFNQAIEKMQELIANLVAGPLGRFLDVIVSITENTWLLAGIIGGVLAANLIKMAKAARIARSASIGEAIASIWNAAFKSLGGLPGIGIILATAAAAAGVAALYSATQKGEQNVQDGIAPAGNGPFTITDGFGRTAITARGDGLAVSPNINRGGGNGDIIAAIDKLASRPAVAYINGENAFVNQIGRNSNLGTSQMQNTSYRLA
jgi:hypothetical protein